MHLLPHFLEQSQFRRDATHVWPCYLIVQLSGSIPQSAVDALSVSVWDLHVMLKLKDWACQRIPYNIYREEYTRCRIWPLRPQGMKTESLT